MRVARITGPGLAAISLAVALLWGCLIGERIVIHRAATERARVLRELYRLRQEQRSEPASTPALHVPAPRHQTAG